MEILDCTQVLEFDTLDDQLRAIQKPISNKKAKVAYLIPCTKNNQTYPLYEGENVIGRSLSCGVRIDNKVLSKKHAIVEIDKGSFFIQDQNSLNGTFKGKVKLKPMVMYNLDVGEVLTFGNLGFKLNLQHQASSVDSSPPISPTQACSDPTFTFNENNNVQSVEQQKSQSISPKVTSDQHEDAVSTGTHNQNSDACLLNKSENISDPNDNKSSLASDDETDSELEDVRPTLKFKKNLLAKENLSDDETASGSEFQVQKKNKDREKKVGSKARMEERKRNLNLETQDVLSEDLTDMGSEEESLLVQTAENAPECELAVKKAIGNEPVVGSAKNDLQLETQDVLNEDLTDMGSEDESLLVQAAEAEVELAAKASNNEPASETTKRDLYLGPRDEVGPDQESLLVESSDTKDDSKCKKCNGNNTSGHMCLEPDSYEGDMADDSLLFQPTQPYNADNFISDKNRSLPADNEDPLMLQPTQPYYAQNDKPSTSGSALGKLNAACRDKTSVQDNEGEQVSDDVLLAQTQPFKDNFAKPLNLTPRRMKRLLPSSSESVDPNAFTQPCISLDDFEEVDDFDLDSQPDKRKNDNNLLEAETQQLEESRKTKNGKDNYSFIAETQPLLSKGLHDISSFAETQSLALDQLQTPKRNHKNNSKEIDPLLAETQAAHFKSSEVVSSDSESDNAENESWMNSETQKNTDEGSDWMNAETQPAFARSILSKSNNRLRRDKTRARSDWMNAETQKCAEEDSFSAETQKNTDEDSDLLNAETQAVGKEDWKNAETQPVLDKNILSKSKNRLSSRKQSPNQSTPKGFSLQFEDSFPGNTSRVSDILCMDSQPNSREETTPLTSRKRSINDSLIVETPSDISPASGRRNVTVDSYNQINTSFEGKISTSTPNELEGTVLAACSSQPDSLSSTVKNTDCSSVETASRFSEVENLDLDKGLNSDTCTSTLKNSDVDSRENSETARNKTSSKTALNSCDALVQKRRNPKLIKKKVGEELSLPEPSTSVENTNLDLELQEEVTSENNLKILSNAVEDDPSVEVTEKRGKKSKTRGVSSKPKEEVTEEPKLKRSRPRKFINTDNSSNVASPYDSLEQKTRVSSRARRLPAKLQKDFEMQDNVDNNRATGDKSDTIAPKSVEQETRSKNSENKKQIRSSKKSSKNLSDTEEAASSSSKKLSPEDSSSMSAGLNAKDASTSKEPHVSEEDDKPSEVCENLSEVNGKVLKRNKSSKSEYKLTKRQKKSSPELDTADSGKSISGEAAANTTLQNSALDKSENKSIESSNKRSRLKGKSSTTEGANSNIKSTDSLTEEEHSKDHDTGSLEENLPENTEKTTKVKRKRHASSVNTDTNLSKINDNAENQTNVRNDALPLNGNTLSDSSAHQKKRGRPRRKVPSENLDVEENKTETAVSLETSLPVESGETELSGRKVLPKRRGRPARRNAKCNDTRSTSSISSVDEDNLSTVTEVSTRAPEPPKRKGRPKKEDVQRDQYKDQTYVKASAKKDTQHSDGQSVDQNVMEDTNIVKLKDNKATVKNKLALRKASRIFELDLDLTDEADESLSTSSVTQDSSAKQNRTEKKSKVDLTGEGGENLCATLDRATKRSRTKKKSKVTEEQVLSESSAGSSCGKKRNSSTDSNTPVKKRPGRKGSDSSVERQSGSASESNSQAVGKRLAAIKKQASVLFTGISDVESEELITSLGGTVVNEVSACTHLCTDKFRRTVKFLCCVGKGIPIVGMDWVAACKREKRFVDAQDYILHDKAAEKNYSFQLSKTLQAAQQVPLYENWSMYVTPSVVPKADQMKEIIECAGGKFLTKSPNRFMDQILIISCEADKKQASRFLKMGFPVVSNEFVLTGLVRHKVCFKEFSLSF